MAATILNPRELLASLKEDEPAPVYLLAGSDRFRSEKTARWLREKSVDGAMGDLNAGVIYAEDKSPAAIAQEASAFPMFGGRRFLWVRHAEALPAGTAIEPLLKYLENPSPSTVLCFTSSKMDKRLKFTSACGIRGKVVDFAPLDGRELFGQVARQAKGHGLELAAGAAEILVELVGEDLAELDSELAKLGLYHEATAGPLTPEEMRELVGRSRDIDAFALADALNPQQAGHFLRGWFSMRSRGGDVYGAAAILGWRLRQIAQLRSAFDAGLDPRSASAKLGLGAWQMRGLEPLAAASSTELVDSTLAGFRQADLRSKSSSLGADLAWDLALLEWALGGRPA